MHACCCSCVVPGVVFFSFRSLVWLLGRILISGSSGLWATRDAITALRYCRRVTCGTRAHVNHRKHKRHLYGGHTSALFTCEVHHLKKNFNNKFQNKDASQHYTLWTDAKNNWRKLETDAKVTLGLCAVPCNKRYHTLKNYRHLIGQIAGQLIRK